MIKSRKTTRQSNGLSEPKDVLIRNRKSINKKIMELTVSLIV